MCTPHEGQPIVKPDRTVFVCQECGAQSLKWLGRCAECGSWNSLVEERPQPGLTAGADRYGTGTATSARLYAEIEMARHARLNTGIDEFDRVLGGGIVPGSMGGAWPVGLITKMMVWSSTASV